MQTQTKTMNDRRVKTAYEFFMTHTNADTRSDTEWGGMEGDSLNGAAHLYYAPNREKWLWLRRRLKTIGASDAPTIEGLTDGWRTAKQLFDEMRGTAEPADLTGNELVDMGNAEEPIVRTLFALENPQYSVYDGSNLLWVSREHPWMSCTLDAILVNDETGGISDLEIKCAPWSAKWGDDFLPDNYFVQLLWQMAVTGIDTAFLKARLRISREVIGATEKVYCVEARNEDVRPQMDALIEHGKHFYDMLQTGNYFPMGIRI